MTEIKPFIDCVDYWPGEIPQSRLDAYKLMVAEGQIMKQHVYLNKKYNSTIIAYRATVPHEWILEEMRKVCE